jgi:redox-sensitive bicupin YhaK (pirin superfamily)
MKKGDIKQLYRIPFPGEMKTIVRPGGCILKMKSILHKAVTRGHANHGWLDTYHTFSFANYHHPERMHFGALRVLNDDTVAPGMGFGTHPHDNMEIVSIPLEGDLEHRDSMGNVALIRSGDLQVMSAGRGIMHSEYNRNSDREVKFLQIWVFPDIIGAEPRYDQISLGDIKKENEFYQVLSPDMEDPGVWIHQQAWFHLGEFSRELSTSYRLRKEGNGVYTFVLNGDVEIEGQQLTSRDGFGLWDTGKIHVRAHSGCRLLLMEVPMKINLSR